MPPASKPVTERALPVALCSTLCVVSFATTQASAADPLSPITVTATRSNSVAGETPQKVTIITREQIERQLATTSDQSQILSNLIPSYSPSRQKLTNSGETFRGRDALILIDGVPQSTPVRDGARDGYIIDLSMVERIEVIYGASAEQGLGATGGIINYVTKRADGGAFNQRFSTSITSADDLESEGFGHKLNYQFSGQQGDWDYVAAATHQERGIFYDGDGRRIGIDGVQGETQDSSSYDLLFKLGYWLDDNQNLELSINHFRLENNGDYVAVDGDRSEGIPTTSRKGDSRGDPAYNEVTTASLTYSHADLAGNQLDVQLYRQRFRAQFGGSIIPTYQDPAIAPIGTLFEQSRNESDKTGGKFTLSRDGMLDDRLTLTTGVDVLRDTTQQALVQTGRTYVPETQFDNYAVFLQGDYALTDDLTLHAGVRREYAQLDVDTYQTIASNNGVTVEGGSPSFDETLYNVGAVYQATDWVQFFASYSEGFGIPDVGRALRGIDQPNRSVDELLQLRPIVTDNREIGTRIGWHPVSFELSYYESESDFGERLEEVGGVFVGSREKVEIRGVVLSGDVQLNDAHSLRVSYAHSEGRSDTDGDGNVDTKLSGINIAPDDLTVAWNASWTDMLGTYVQFRHFFSRDFDDPALKFSGYNLVAAALVYQLPVGSMSLGIDNLLDEDYFTYYSQSARIGDDQYFKGRGRTLKLGYQVDF